jgi:arylsulfatase A-like enzyme
MRVVDWLKNNGYLGADHPDAPFFVWVHFFDPHDPYDPPPDERAHFDPKPTERNLLSAIANYDAEIRFADREMGAIFDALDQANRFAHVITIVVGDHGEGLMQHGTMHHGLSLYEEQMRVPFVFHWPSVLKQPQTIEAPVEIEDLAPTVLELAGLARPPEFQGRSLAGVIRGEESADPERLIFLQRRHYDATVLQGVRVVGEQFGLRSGRWKYIEAPGEGTFELFDLATDPHEHRNVFEERGEQASELARVLHAWAESPAAGPAESVSPEDVEKLRALGYVP